MKKKRRKLLVKYALLFLALAVISLLAALIFLKKNTIDVEHDVSVVIIGEEKHYSEQEIRERVFESRAMRVLPYFNWYRKKHELPTLPLIDRVTASVADDGTIVLTAYEKRPVGALLEMGSYVYFDSNGMVITTRKEPVEGIPVVKGLQYKSLVLGAPFETKNPELFHVILGIVRQLEKRSIQCEQMYFSPKGEVTLSCEGNIIEMGLRETYDVQLLVLRDLLLKIREGEARYRIDLKNVYDGTEQVIATTLGEDDTIVVE